MKIFDLGSYRRYKSHVWAGWRFRNLIHEQAWYAFYSLPIARRILARKVRAAVRKEYDGYDQSPRAKKIPWIKWTRRVTGMGLKLCKLWVETFVIPTWKG